MIFNFSNLLTLLTKICKFLTNNLIREKCVYVRIKWFAYFLILFEAFAKNLAKKKGFYHENAKAKKLQNLYLKKKNLNSMIHLIWTQNVANPKQWWFCWWWQINIGEMNCKITQICNGQGPTILSNFKLYSTPGNKKRY